MSYFDYAKNNLHSIGGIPNYTLISPDGIVLEQWTGYHEGCLKQKVDE